MSSRKTTPHITPLAASIRYQLRFASNAAARIAKEYNHFNKQAPELAGLVLHRGEKATQHI